MRAKISPAAKERLLEIWEYTDRKWGEEQADKYVRGLVESANRAYDARHRWRPVMDAALKGVFFIRHEHHYIFFRELSDHCIGVISIIHESMDIPARLKDDARRDRSE